MYLVNTMVIKTNPAVPVLMNIICGEERQSIKYMIVINSTRDKRRAARQYVLWRFLAYVSSQGEPSEVMCKLRTVK